MKRHERQLIDRLKANPRGSAFTDLIKQYQSPLRYSLRQMTRGDNDLADDIAQETFIKAYTAIYSFRGESSLATWLYQIAMRLLISHHRKTRELLLDEDALEAISEPLYEVTITDLEHDLSQALAHLPMPQRVVLHLVLHREFTLSEVAEMLECPLGTVKSHLRRGKERLQQMLAAWQPDSFSEEVSK